MNAKQMRDWQLVVDDALESRGERTLVGAPLLPCNEAILAADVIVQAAWEYVRARAACDVDIHPDAIIHIDALARVRDDAHDALLTAVGEVSDATE